MNLITRRFIAVFAAITFVAAPPSFDVRAAAPGGGETASGFALMKLRICPPGWVPATPPLNTALGCLPNNLYFSAGEDGARDIPPGRCPDGWAPVTPPLNPVLLCLPTQLAPAGAAVSSSSRFSARDCPRGWVNLNDRRRGALICLPLAVALRLPDPAGSGVPPGQCPEGWRPVTPPLNPVLGCLPNTLIAP